MTDICKDTNEIGKNPAWGLRQILAAGTDPARLLDLAQADRHGLVQIFPCKVHDTVWFIKKLNGRPEIIETHVEKLVVKSTGVYLKLACNAMYETSAKSIGKTIFFDKSSAEAAAQTEKRK